MDDADDMQIYTRHRTEICEAIAEAVCAGLGIQKLESEVEEMTKDELRRLIREEIAAVAAEQKLKNPGAWSKADREWAEENGLLRGTDKGMEYQAPVTREQLAAVLHRYDAYHGGV